MLSVVCPNCDADCQPEELSKWAAIGSTVKDDIGCVPCLCACGQIFWVTLSMTTNTVNKDVAAVEAIPPLPDGLVVVIDNREHRLHGRSGTIVASKHLHYRINIDGDLIWMPSHWIKVHQHG